MRTAVIPAINRLPNFNNYYYPRQRVTTVAATDVLGRFRTCGITTNPSSKPFIMTATAAERYHHVVHVWMKASGFVTRALSISGISTYHDLVRLLDNPDEINALRNRNLDYHDEDGDPVPGQPEWTLIHAGTADRFRYCRSFINVLQLKYGPVIDDGLVDFTTKNLDDFEDFLSARGPFVEYSEDRATVLLHQREDRVALLVPGPAPPRLQAVLELQAALESETQHQTLLRVLQVRLLLRKLNLGHSRRHLRWMYLASLL
eukprot:scaffold17373_cov121-Skeletonema_marinoi.AAC.1